MHPAQIFLIVAVVVAAVAIGVPRDIEEHATGSIETAITSLVSDLLSCEQPLYLEELELLTGAACGAI